LASWFVEAAAAEPLAPARRRTKPIAAPKPKSRAKARARARSRAGIAWIVVSGVLLTGVVFVNVAVLRLNLQLDKASQQQTQLHAETAALQSQLSSQLASPRIQAIARNKDGLVEADPTTIGYINLGR
jgi:cell division protein FtsL